MGGETFLIAVIVLQVVIIAGLTLAFLRVEGQLADAREMLEHRKRAGK